MNEIAFFMAFILQFVGHRIGDFLIQTNWQATNKSKNAIARLRHCLVYSTVISLIMLIGFDWQIAAIVWAVTLAEHYWIDTGKPLKRWVHFMEHKLAKDENYNISQMPFFVQVELDQTIHIIRIFVISLALGIIA